MSKHVLKRAGAFLIVTLLAAAAPVSAQRAYAVPKKVGLERLVRRTFPSYFGRQRYTQLVPEGFFPIGWSRDGKFAYYTEPVDEACGCYFASLVIQDLRTDKVVWEFKYDQDEAESTTGKRSPEDTIAKLWKKNRKLFSAKLSENGIEQISNLSLLGKTFATGGATYTASLVAPHKKDDDGFQRVRSVTVSLRSARLGQKTLYSADYTSDMDASPLDAGVVGVFKSPFGGRVAVVMIEVHRGYEGPPHPASVRIVGADLISGFSGNASNPGDENRGVDDE